MGRYKAAFFDRDNTLTTANPTVAQWRNAQIKSWSGKDFICDYERMMRLFGLAGYPADGLKSVEEEIAFQHRYFTQILLEEGVKGSIEEKAAELFEGTWLKNRKLFPEVMQVLDYFKENGYKLGVISDTSPSLRLTLETLGLGGYFDCYICSDIVGVMKPDPQIYNAALSALGVAAEESLYVDDYDVEADGARALGFTAFHIIRSADKEKSEWDIRSLLEMVEFVKRHDIGAQ